MGVAVRDGHHALRRSIRLLLALARLAEIAGARCFPVRFVVLALLARAEAVARAHAAEVLPAWPGLDAPPDVCGRPGDAAALALRLRALAAAFAAILRWTCLAEGCRIAAPCPPGAAPARRLPRCAPRRCARPTRPDAPRRVSFGSGRPGGGTASRPAGARRLSRARRSPSPCRPR